MYQRSRSPPRKVTLASQASLLERLLLPNNKMLQRDHSRVSCQPLHRRDRARQIGHWRKEESLRATGSMRVAIGNHRAPPRVSLQKVLPAGLLTSWTQIKLKELLAPNSSTLNRQKVQGQLLVKVNLMGCKRSKLQLHLIKSQELSKKDHNLINLTGIR
jgi:hypothetical protein